MQNFPPKTTALELEPQGEAEKLVDAADSMAGQIDGDVRFDQYSRMLYSTDASVYQIMPLGVVLPRTADDVQCVLEHANRYGFPVLPRGGGSSLAGQAVGTAVVLDFSRYMQDVIEVNVEEETLRVQPGMNLQSMNLKLRKHGLMIGPDPASANRATIGGCVGNNSAGSHSILYGMMIDNVIETDVYLSDGTFARFRPLDADEARRKGELDSLEGRIYSDLANLVLDRQEDILTDWPRHWRRASGYALDRLLPPLVDGSLARQLYLDSPLVPAAVRDRTDHRLNLSNLMVGSEGTLGVVTEVQTKLVRVPAHTGLLVFHFESVVEACSAVVDVLAMEPSASELLDRQLMDLARAKLTGGRNLFFIEGDPAAVLLTEFYGKDEREVRLKADRLRDHMQRRGWKGAVTVVEDPAAQAKVWDLRKSSLNLLMGQRGQHKPFPGIEDVSVPVEHLADYMDGILNYCAGLPDVPSTAVYAHASAGCLHVRPLINLHTARGAENLKLAGEHSLELARQCNGVMSGEHGDGLARSYYNQSLFTTSLYGTLQQVKHLFDPDGRLNPGKIVDAQTPIENLRFGADYKAQGWSTVFDWTTDHGFDGSVEMCNGAGVCRKLDVGTMCPSFMATREEKHSTRGRANSLRNAMAGRIPREELWTKDMYEVMDLCLGCKACKTECPSSVDMARIKVEYLQAYNDHNGMSLFTRLMGLMPGALRLLSSQAGWLFPALNAMARSPLGRWGMRRLGMHPERSFPAFRQASLERAPNAQSLAGSKTRAVTLWVDTWSRFFQPEVAKAAGNVLAKLGYDVEILYDTGCCGRPLITGGQLRKARVEADRLCRELMEPVGRGRTIVGLEPSCILTLRDEFPDLATDRGLATTVANNSRTLEEFLVESGVEPLDLDASSQNVWLHSHCHQRALVPGNPTADLLNNLGFNTRVIPSGCCGMAGEFGYLDHHYEVSQAVGEDRLFPAIREMPANGSLVASGFSCREQISHFTDRRALHLAEFLDQRIGAQQPVQPE